MSEKQEPSSTKRNRRDVLGLAGVGAAGLVAGASLGAPEAASAADGDPLLMGRGNETPPTTNLATSKTQLNTGGTITNDGAFKVVAANADYGVIGSAKIVGAFGSGVVGILGDGAVGGQFSGTDAAINLDPRANPGPPGGTNFKGDVIVDADGVLWLCVANGTPGTWIQVSHGGARLLAAPQRAYDSRFTTKFSGNETRQIPIVGTIHGGVTSGVPANAVGMVGNLTVLETIGVSWLTAFPGDAPYPGTSNLNWYGNNQIVANSATIRLGTFAGGPQDGRVGINVFVEKPTHVIVDIVGYIL